MENASKALIMAGSILMSLMIIGIAIFAYRQLSEVQQIKSNVEDAEKLQSYMQKFEQYNKTIYGSELLSLGNLQLDYNYRQSDLNGYKPVTITVKMKQDVSENGKTYVPSGEQQMATIRKGILNLEDDISYYETDKNGYNNKKESQKRSVKYYAQLSNRQIATLFEINYSSNEADYEIGDRLADSIQNPKTSKLCKDIEIYKNLKTVYTEFKNKRFNCEDMKLDVNNSVESMNFVEK